jgi:hypothetical protein
MALCADIEKPSGKMSRASDTEDGTTLAKHDADPQQDDFPSRLKQIFESDCAVSHEADTEFGLQPPPPPSTHPNRAEPCPMPSRRPQPRFIPRSSPPQVLSTGPRVYVGALNSFVFDDAAVTPPSSYRNAILPDWLPPMKGSFERKNRPYYAEGPPVPPNTEVFIPEGLGATDKIYCVPYDDTPNMPFRTRPPDRHPALKMGGVNMDVSADAIYNILVFLIGPRVDFVEMFSAHQGRCTIYLSDPSVANALRAAADHTFWMAPQGAFIATTLLSRFFLSAYVDRVKKMVRSSQMFPRHLVTMEPWEVLERAKPNRRQGRLGLQHAGPDSLIVMDPVASAVDCVPPPPPHLPPPYAPTC